jgi:hypothetical protein
LDAAVDAEVAPPDPPTAAATASDEATLAELEATEGAVVATAGEDVAEVA